MQLIALFFPSILGVSNCVKLKKNFESIVRYIYTYIIFILCTNVFTMFTVVYVLGVDGVVSEALTSFSFFMIYTVMACIYSVVGSVVANIVHRNFVNHNIS